METLALLLFAAFISNSSCFWFDRDQPVDCAWLPWKYETCAMIRQGVYRKRESRGKINAINGGKPCKSLPTTRTTRSCVAADYIASTIWTAVNPGKKPKSVSRPTRRPSLTFPGTNVIRRPGFFWNVASTAPTFTIARNVSRTQNCLHVFNAGTSGIKMLGNKCRRRGRRSTHIENIKSRVKRQFPPAKIPSNEHRDVLFLVDESGSVEKTNFKKELKLVKTLAGSFCDQREIHRLKTRVSVATFSEDPSHRIHFDRYYDRSAFLNAVDSISYRDDKDGATCLIDALKEARTKMFTTGRGSRVPSGTADGLLILITDGCKNCYRGGDVEEKLAEEQKKLEDAGISILTFMINVGSKCEVSFNTLDDGSDCFQGFSYPSWTSFETELIARLEELGSTDCIDRWTKMEESCP